VLGDAGGGAAGALGGGAVCAVVAGGGVAPVAVAGGAEPVAGAAVTGGTAGTGSGALDGGAACADSTSDMDTSKARAAAALVRLAPVKSRPIPASTTFFFTLASRPLLSRRRV
jgi:hypothetical protein